jgi:hypothetical protein
MDIKPIETVFRGHKFRSRLEARWAVFFSELGIPYEYELEGYELSNGVKYLPDFYIPSLALHIEVKPHQQLTDNEIKKLICFSADGDKPTLLIVGTPGAESMYLLDRTTLPGWDEFADYESVVDRLTAFWELLSDWGSVAFGVSPRNAVRGWVLVYKNLPPNNDYQLHAALHAAKQARFEHGAKG